MEEGLFTIPTRIYLTAEQRAKLEWLLRDQERELDELLSALVADFLAAAPDRPAEEPMDGGVAEELHQRRAELRRLRPKLNDPYNPPPSWLVALAAELETEIKRLERLQQA